MKEVYRIFLCTIASLIIATFITLGIEGFYMMRYNEIPDAQIMTQDTLVFVLSFMCVFLTIYVFTAKKSILDPS